MSIFTQKMVFVKLEIIFFDILSNHVFTFLCNLHTYNVFFSQYMYCFIYYLFLATFLLHKFQFFSDSLNYVTNLLFLIFHKKRPYKMGSYFRSPPIL